MKFGIARNRSPIVLFLLSFFIVACGSTTPSAQPQTVTVYAASSAEPWMNEIFVCANERTITVYITANDPEISIRIGEPEDASGNVYQIGEEELLVAVNRESSMQALSLEEVQALFSGQGEVSVWVYPSELDLSGLFDQFVMEGRSVTSFASVAVSPDEMLGALISDPNAIGILPRRWLTGDIREVYAAGEFPVIAVTNEEPQGAVYDLLACLQK